jgi:alcohol dehydrogenase
MSQDFFEFFCPVKIVSGHKALEHIPFELEVRGARRPLLISDAGVVGAGLVDAVSRAMSAAEVADRPLFDGVPPDSSMASVTAAVSAYRDEDCDSIIAIGGGSVMDTAKAVNILATEGGEDLPRFAGANNLNRPLKPFIAIPTTAGTGSEVTSVSIIKDEQSGTKMPFMSQFLLPDVAVLDPRTTLKLPAMITAATALDALTHACEAFTCLAKNPLSDAYASAAIKRIAQSLIPVLDAPDDAGRRLDLALAATMAGIAFSNSMVGLVHALGHNVGAVAGVHHGVCMGILLPHVLQYNLEARKQEIGEMLLYLSGPDNYAATPPAERASAAIKRIRQIKNDAHARCGLPRNLAETGKLKKDDLPRIATMSLDDGSIIFNPVEAGYEDALAILERAWA